MVKLKDTNLLEFPCVDVVEASAGSGKTYALAKRYLKLIMDPRLKSEELPLKTILAITFTNKATVEMKQRILEFLKKIALDAFSDKREKEEIASSLPLDSNVAKRKAHKVMDDIISNYSFFQIQTIDSFINTLLSGCVFHLGLASNFRIKENYRAYLEYSLDRLIDMTQTDKDILKIFEELLEYYLFVENKEGWFSKREILALIKSLYNYSSIYGGMFKGLDVELSQIWKKKKTILNLARKIRDAAPEQSNGHFINSLDSFLENKIGSFDIKDLSLYFDRKEFPINKKNVDVPKNIVKLWNGMRKTLREFCELESYAIFKPYIELFNLVLNDFRELSGYDDVIFLQELNTHAQSLVGDASITVDELYYRLATRLRHYLIDEFQDTNRLQWRNLFPMIDEALSSGGSLFYVGDKKQAIYRFRGGDTSLFDSVQNNFANFSPEHTVLDKNYRSQREIVEFNNEVFSSNNIKRFVKELDTSQKNPFRFSEVDVGKVLDVFSDSKQKRKDENVYGYVKIEAVDAGSVDEGDIIMRQKLISLVKDLKNRFSFQDLAILARENRDVKLFSLWLIEEGIPVESDKTLNIREHSLIKELISFLKFLNSPIDNLSFASFILGDIFQKVAGIKRDTIRDFLFRLRRRGRKEKGVYLYREFRNRFSDVWDALIEEFFKNVGFIPLYELVISILGKFKVMGHFPECQGFFMKFLELIKEKEEDYAGISSFIEFFEDIEEKDLYVNVTYADSVKITTIHKAKGLEFPVVIIPFLEIDVTVGSGGTESRKPYVIKQAEDNSLSLLQLKKRYGAYSKKLNDEYKNEYIRSLIDELNNLYVALTRAKYEMYLFIPAKTGNKNNTARIFIPYDMLERGSRREYKKPADEKKKSLMALPVSQYSDWISILKDEFIDRSQLINRDSVLKGEMLHFILSCVGNLYIQNKDAYLNVAKEKARPAFPYVKNLNEYISVVHRLLENEKLKPFFYIKEGSLYQEKEIVDLSGNTKRIDRLIIMPKEVWIVDYKSSKEESDMHREQILEYMKIIKPLYPKLKTRSFLIYLDTLAIEEVYEAEEVYEKGSKL